MAGPDPGRDPDGRPSRPIDPRTLDLVFGDVLPTTTDDERGHGRPGHDDRWYLENRPPHHDR